MQDHAGSSPQGHPYFPQDAIIPGYAPNTTPLLNILAAFGGIIGVFVLGSVTLATWYSPALKRADQLTVAWFALCAFRFLSWGSFPLRAPLFSTLHLTDQRLGGFLHLFFEGYFVLNHAIIPSSQSLFAQLWKEYALSDSRYLTSDPFMLCIESLTVVCLLPHRPLSPSPAAPTPFPMLPLQHI
jgi:cholestenol delta-isomerase